jgi:hypothetical protein
MMLALRNGTTWACPDGATKLRARAQLPGAFAFDHAQAGLSAALARGVPIADLLAPAFASSWLVNSDAPSPVFRKWLSAPDLWGRLVAALASGWLGIASQDKVKFAAGVRALAVEGQSTGALSKVLALFVPEAVPLMPDRAVWFALRSVPRGKDLDAQTAPIEELVPMLDWFAEQAQNAELASVASAVGLSPARALDRLLWFDSAGYQHFEGFHWVKDGECEAVVHVDLPIESGAEPIDLATVSPGWREAAQRAMTPSR